MGSFRKKPVTVEAHQWRPDAPVAAGMLVGLLMARGIDFDVVGGCGLRFFVNKGGSMATIAPNDWVIAEADGDGFYPCVDEQFRASYESVED